MINRLSLQNFKVRNAYIGVEAQALFADRKISAYVIVEAHFTLAYSTWELGIDE